MTIKGDLIDNLPTDESEYDENLANMLFKEKKTINNVFRELKETIILVGLFLVFSSEQFENFIKNIYPPSANNKIALMGIKCVSVALLFYFLKNFEFARVK